MLLVAMLVQIVHTDNSVGYVIVASSQIASGLLLCRLTVNAHKQHHMQLSNHSVLSLSHAVQECSLVLAQTHLGSTARMTHAWGRPLRHGHVLGLC